MRIYPAFLMLERGEGGQGFKSGLGEVRLPDQLKIFTKKKGVKAKAVWGKGNSVQVQE